MQRALVVEVIITITTIGFYLCIILLQLSHLISQHPVKKVRQVMLPPLQMKLFCTVCLQFRFSDF